MTPPPAQIWHLGLDLGQSRDHSALATLALESDRLVVRGLERFPLGTSYTFYAEAVAERVRQVRALAPHSIVTITVDASGPGAAVVDGLRAACSHTDIQPVIITAGNRRGRSASGRLTVPRKWLLANLVRLLDAGTLLAPLNLANWHLFCAEMLALDAATSHPGHPASHDDIVIALALAAWNAASGPKRAAISNKLKAA